MSQKTFGHGTIQRLDEESLRLRNTGLHLILEMHRRMLGACW